MKLKRKSTRVLRMKKYASSTELSAMREEEDLLQEMISQQERFLTDLPKKAQATIREEEEQIMPPPEEVLDRQREHVFNAMLSENQIRNNRRYEARSTSLIIMLGVAGITMIVWAWKIAQSGF